MNQKPLFHFGRRENGLSGILDRAAAFMRAYRSLIVISASFLFLVTIGVIFSLILKRSLNTGAAQATSAVVKADGSHDASSAAADRALDAAYSELGAGADAVTRAFVRDRDIEYALQEGDSLYSIGKLYVIGVRELQDYNRIEDPARLPVGSIIVIPSKKNLEDFLKKRESQRLSSHTTQPAPASLLPPSLSISATIPPDHSLLTAELKVETQLPPSGIYYRWDLGDGSVAHAPALTYHYAAPGVYTVSLTVLDKYGYELKSNAVTLEIGSGETTHLHRTMHLSVNAVGDMFVLPGKVIQLDDFSGRGEHPIQFVEERDGAFFYRATAPGNYSLVSRGGETTYKIYLFISPFPSVQNDRIDVDWYRTQFNTGSSNCGPASVSMAVAWAKGQYVSVAAVRRYLGFQGNGGTSFSQLQRALAWQGVSAREADITRLEDIFSIIDRGEIAVILFHTAGVSRTRGRPDIDYVGRYYLDRVGHYAIVKGYTTDQKYLMVYDPLPSDWSSNSARYGDGYSMIGKNRFYPVSEIARSIIVPKMLVISR